MSDSFGFEFKWVVDHQRRHRLAMHQRDVLASKECIHGYGLQDHCDHCVSAYVASTAGTQTPVWGGTANVQVDL